MLAETTGVSNKVYSYDANGNTLTVYKDGTLVASYSYGLFGTQDSYTNNAVQYTYYAYRPDGLRHSIGNTIHLWDGANIVADVEGNSVTLYIRGINLIYADDGSKTYYHFNAHGDVVVLTNASGTKTKTYSYNAFGTEYNPGTYDTNPFRYCGEYYDTVSGTIYLRARYYSSDFGRFMQQDGWEFANPEDPLSLNLYTYCWSNPVNKMDPTGTTIEDFFTWTKNTWAKTTNWFNEAKKWADNNIKNSDGTYSLYDNQRGKLYTTSFHEQLFVYDPVSMNSEVLSAASSAGGSVIFYSGGWEGSFLDSNLDLSLFDFGTASAEMWVAPYTCGANVGAALWSPSFEFEVNGLTFEIGANIVGAQFGFEFGNGMGVNAGIFNISFTY